MIARRLLILATLLLVAGAAAWLHFSREKRRRSHTPVLHQPEHELYRAPSASAQNGDRNAANSRVPSPSPESDPRSRLEGAAEALRRTSSAEAARQLLVELRAYLTGLQPEAATEALRGFLESRMDVPTKLSFVIAPNGQLVEAPSLRVWLLDCLGEINRDAAADYATTILSTPSSADEWAVSLRDYAIARTSSEDLGYVQAKTRELMQNFAWRQNPSIGFLEAFDAIVHTKATDLTADLAELLRDKENRAVAHAAYLTLDRLIIEKPTDVLAQLVAHPEAMQGREPTRANYFARADVRDPEQRQLLERYLLDPRRASQELQTFAGVYPNANFMISHNLLTRPRTPTRAELVAHDREALMVVTTWLQDPRFATIKPQIEQIHSRLRAFVGDRGTPRESSR